VAFDDHGASRLYYVIHVSAIAQHESDWGDVDDADIEDVVMNPSSNL
jgi:hypothetical protein